MKDNRLAFFIAGTAAGALALHAIRYFNDSSAYYKYCTQWWKSKQQKLGLLHSNDGDEASQRAPTSQVNGINIRDALEDEILSEQFTRNVQFFGKEGQSALHGAFVVIVGLGVSLHILVLTNIISVFCMHSAQLAMETPSVSYSC